MMKKDGIAQYTMCKK